MPVKTYCRICEAACGLVAEVGEGRVQSLRPDRDHPVSRGFVCAKGTRFAEVAYHPERLMTPAIRGSDGALRSASWDEANALVIERIEAIRRAHGPHAVGLYFGNPIAFNSQAAAVLPSFTKVLATRNVFSAGSQDCNNKFAGARIVYGSPILQPFPDFDRADLAVVLGSNPYVSQSSFVHLPGGSLTFQRLIDRGGHVVWIDPRRTESAERWGEHLAVRPGTDAFLLLSLLHLLGDDARPAEGLEALLAAAAEVPLSETAARTGLSTAQIVALAERIRASRATAFHMSVGVNQSGFGTLCFVILQALAHVTGNLDREGGLLVNPASERLATMFSRAKLDTVRKSRVGAFDSNMGTMPGGIMADEILTAGPDRIRALIVLAGDPLLSMPGGARLREALASLELLVTIDMFENETGKLAHVILPTSSWLERFDVATTTLQFSSHGLLQAADAVIPPRGECRHDARILCDLAGGLGGGRAFALGRLPWDRILRWVPRRRYGFPAPKPRPGAFTGRRPPRFWDPSLAAEIARLREPPANGGFLLMCRRRRLGHNSWLHGGARQTDEPFAWMHGDDLAALGRPGGGRIVVRTAAGELAIDAQPSSGVARRTVVIPHGLGELNVNALVPATHDDIERLSGTHRMSAIAADVRAV